MAWIGGRRAAWPLAAVAASAVTALAVATGVGGAARVGEYSSSTGARIKITNVPAIGQDAFSGVWGTASIDASGGRDQADYDKDPDGVKKYVTIVSPSGGTSGDTGVHAWDATSDPNVLSMRLRPGGPVLLNIATLHTYAQCQPPHAPQVQNYVTAPTVAGQPIKKGTNDITVTGAQLGYPSVAHGTLKVTMTQIQKTTPNISAEARVEITISGRLVGTDGKEIYNGPLADTVFADVRAHCEPAVSPTPTPTATPTPTPTPPGRLDVDKTANKSTVKVGEKVRYTLHAKNVGGQTLDPATFTDDLSDVLAHGDYDHDARASTGTVTYDRPNLTWKGKLAPGKSAIVTYTVTARRPGLMRNVVVWPLPPKPPHPTPKPTPSGKDETKTRVVPRNVCRLTRLAAC